jgi:Pentapeptide repeats (8 copies)
VANPEHLELLRQGVDAWNAWRVKEPSVRPDLSWENLRLAHLNGANFAGANLGETDLSMAHLSGADLSRANLGGARLSLADLSGANLTGANLSGAQLVGTNLIGATLTDCRIYGVSVWNVKLNKDTKQQDLIITHLSEPEVTTDDLEVAQFIYLLLHNEKLQRVIDTITSKVVLILGSFSAERKMVLDALRDELRKHNYVPVVFDFEKPRNLTTVNTIVLLARMARFVVADLSDAKSVLQELQEIVPGSPKLPVLPIIVAGQDEPGMFDSFEACPWFLKVYRYENLDQLLVDLKERVIDPLEDAVTELRRLP